MVLIDEGCGGCPCFWVEGGGEGVGVGLATAVLLADRVQFVEVVLLVHFSTILINYIDVD